MTAVLVLSTLLMGPGVVAQRGATAADDYFVYIGNWSSDRNEGIYAWRFTPSSGALAPRT